MTLPALDRPVSWIHFRLLIPQLHPVVAMPQPGPATNWAELSELGISRVLRLAAESPRYDPFPLESLREIALEDLLEVSEPSDPTAEERKIGRAAALLHSTLEDEGVAVHCVGGRGRTGTVIGALLRRCGMDPELIRILLDRAYQNAGRPGWPESEWQADVVRRIRVT